MARLLQIIKRHKFIIIGCIVLLGGGWYAYATFFHTNRANAQQFQTTQVKNRDITSSLTVVGTVTPVQTAALSFGTTAKLTGLYVQNGQHVESGSLLAEIDSTDLKAQLMKDQASLDSAKAQLLKTQQGLSSLDRNALQISLENSRTSYENSKKSAESDIQTAQINLDNAKKIYDATTISSDTSIAQTIKGYEDAITNAQNSLKATLTSTAASIKSGQNSIDTAELNLENTKKNAQASSSVQDQNLSKTQEDSFYSAVSQMDLIDTSLRKINDIITVEDYNKDQNFKFRQLLGVQKSNSYNLTIEAYNSLKGSFNESKNLFVITDTPLPYDEIVRRLSTLKSMLTNAFNALNITNDMLSNSLTSSDFSQASLDTYRSSILSQRDSVTQALSNIASVQNNVQSIELQKSSNQVSSQNSISSSEKALDTAKQNFENTKAQAAIQELNARNALKTAEDNLAKERANLANTDVSELNSDNTYANAERNLELAKMKAKTQLDSAEASLRSAEAQFAVQTAPADSATMASQAAQVTQAEAALNATKINLEHTKLIAPVTGVVSGITIKQDQNVTSGGTFMTVISDDVNIVETQIAETAVAKVHAGQKVQVSFDAFPTAAALDGSISYVDSAQTLADNLVTYKTQIVFTPSEEMKGKIRSGMTANLEIITSEATNVPSVPNQAIKQEIAANETKYYVETPAGSSTTAAPRARTGSGTTNTQARNFGGTGAASFAGTTNKVYVSIGVKGNDYTEITQGLKENDTIILSSRVPTTAGAANTNRAAAGGTSTLTNQRGNGGAAIPGFRGF